MAFFRDAVKELALTLAGLQHAPWEKVNRLMQLGPKFECE